MNNLYIANKPFLQESNASKAFNKFLNSIVLLSMVISLAIFSFSFSFIDVEVIGPSMQPTINAQWNASETYKRDTAYIKKGSSFTRGDIIVVESSENLHIIKRLIAVAGDSLNIIENELTEDIELYLNGQLLIEDYVVFKDGLSSTFDNFNNLRVDRPELFVGDNLVVPEGQIFYLGDNRGQSLDCSIEGPKPIEKVVGKVSIVVPYGQSFIEHIWKEFILLF